MFWKRKELPWVEKHPGISLSEKLKLYRDECSWPGLYYEITESTLRLFSNPRVLEIGVAYGFHANHILSANQDLVYQGVDPYLAGYDPKDFFVRDVSQLLGNPNPQESMDALFFEVERQLVTGFPDRASLFRGTAQEFARNHKHTQYDFIWVDGDHTFQAVAEDLLFSESVLSKGGIIAGDDYNWPGVKKAIDDFCDLRDFELRVLVRPQKGSHSIFFLTRD